MLVLDVEICDFVEMSVLIGLLLRYLFDFIEPCTLKTGAFARLSRPYKAKQFLLKYYAVGLRLCKLEGKVVPDYNTTFELGQILEWSEEGQRYVVEDSLTNGDIDTMVHKHYNLSSMD